MQDFRFANSAAGGKYVCLNQKFEQVADRRDAKSNKMSFALNVRVNFVKFINLLLCPRWDQCFCVEISENSGSYKSEIGVSC